MVAQDLSDSRIHEQKKPVFTLRQVKAHDSPNDCWIVLFNNVYDITDFLSQHPGGKEVLIENAGRDATMAYQEAGHSISGLANIEQYLIGVLPECERLITKFTF